MINVVEMGNNRYFETNKNTWNEKVGHHMDSDMYGLEAFKKGKSSLMKYELEALGDVKGKSLLHLQCHFGQDTLSWARMGAKCTGVDFSEEGIKAAKQLNDGLGLDAAFVCCNVLDTSAHVKGRFDIVFTSYGVIGWLPDLRAWAKVIADKLKPGGTFYMVEFHPIVWMFEYGGGKPKMKYAYQQKEVIYEEYEGTYANQKSKMISKEYGWNHGLGAVLTALTGVGMRISYLEEYDESPYDVLPELVRNDNGMYIMRHGLYPLIYAIKATKD